MDDLAAKMADAELWFLTQKNSFNSPGAALKSDPALGCLFL